MNNKFKFNVTLVSHMNLKKSKSKKTMEHGMLEVFSYGGGTFLQEFVGTVFGGWLFFFYEIEMELNIWALTVGYIIYSIFNAVNSPILGYYTGKKRLFKSRFGRRFPWLLIAAIPWMLSLFFLYNPPISRITTENDTLFLFSWFLIFICLLSLFGTIFGINYGALYPEKFQTEADRSRASGIVGAISFFGGGLGSFLPAMIIKYGDKSSFSRMASIMLLVGIIAFFLALPGLWEHKEMREKNIQFHQKNSESNFIESMKIALKQKNFLIFIVLFFFAQFVMSIVGAAFPYAVRYVFQKEAIYTAWFALLYIMGAVVSLPIWIRINKKLKDTRKSLLITGIMLISTQFLIFFAVTISSAIFMVILYGFSIAGFSTTIKLRIIGNVIDEVVVNTGKRNESTYIGINGFFVNFTAALQSFIFALVHQLTGFNKNVVVQTELAQIGIRLTLSLIPMIFICIGLIVFLKWYDLTPSKIKSIEARLKQLQA